MNFIITSLLCLVLLQLSIHMVVVHSPFLGYKKEERAGGRGRDNYVAAHLYHSLQV